MSSIIQVLDQQSSNFNHFIIAVFAFLIFAVLFLKWLSKSPSPAENSIPPSPPRIPILGNLHQLGLSPHRSMQSLARRHGTLMLLRLGRKQVLVASSAEAACEIMKTHDVVFSDRPRTSVGNKFLYYGKDVGLAPYGEYWRKMKSVCVLHLLNKKSVQSFQSVREDEISILMKEIKKSCSLSMPVNLSEMFVSLTNNLICRVAFGGKYSEDRGGRKFNKLLKETSKLIGGFYVGDYIPWLCWVNKVSGLDAKVERVAKELDHLLEGIVDQHFYKGHQDECHDFVDVLLEIQKENTAGVPIDRENIKGLLLDIYTGGTETIAAVLEWAMAELIRHPKVMMEVQIEVKRYCIDKMFPTPEDLEKMVYLKAVVKETLRLHPSNPFLVPRQCRQDIKLKGYDIKAGTMVITNAWAIGRDPASWDRPDEFQPKRFLGSSIDFMGHDFELIPFGAGRRSCPGALFAVVTIEQVLACVLHKFNWTLPDGEKVQNLDMTERIGAIVSKKSPLIAVATPVDC